MSFAYLMGFALILGFKHSFDADHLAAVSTMLRRVSSVRESVRLGVSWAVGHMLTAGVVTILLFVFKESVLSVFLSYAEILTGTMLVLLGAFTLRETIWYETAHQHGKRLHAHLRIQGNGASRHVHRCMFTVGVIHGLASNDELLMLLTITLGMTALAGILLGVAMFSLGVVLGMSVFCLVFSLPWFKARSDVSRRIFSLVIGSLSVYLGVSMLLGL
jgi:nickel/cobalt exporter